MKPAVVPYMFVLGLLLAALAPACKTKPQQQHTVTDVRHDSTHTEVREVLRAIPVVVPADSAAIMAMVQCPGELPPFIVYQTDTVTKIVEKGRNQASINLSLVNGVLTAKANCNELEQLVYAKDQYITHYTKLYQQYKDELFKTTTVTYIPPAVYWFIGFNILLILYLIYRGYKWVQKKRLQLSPI